MALIDSEKVESVSISSIKSPKADELRSLLDQAYDQLLLEKEVKAEKDRLLKEADKLRKSLSLPGKIESEIWTTVYKVGGKRKTIKREKLLEAGVPMNVIDECTAVKSVSDSFYIQGKKDKTNDREEE